MPTRDAYSEDLTRYMQENQGSKFTYDDLVYAFEVPRHERNIFAGAILVLLEANIIKRIVSRIPGLRDRYQFDTDAARDRTNAHFSREQARFDEEQANRLVTELPVEPAPAYSVEPAPAYPGPSHQVGQYAAHANQRVPGSNDSPNNPSPSYPSGNSYGDSYSAHVESSGQSSENADSQVSRR